MGKLKTMARLINELRVNAWKPTKDNTIAMITIGRYGSDLINMSIHAFASMHLFRMSFPSYRT